MRRRSACWVVVLVIAAGRPRGRAVDSAAAPRESPRRSSRPGDAAPRALRTCELAEAARRPELADLALYLDVHAAPRRRRPARATLARALARARSRTIWAGPARLDVGRVRRRTGDLDRRARLARRRGATPCPRASATADVVDLQRAEIAHELGDDDDALELSRPTARGQAPRPGRAPRRAGWSSASGQRPDARARPAERLAEAELRLAEGDAQGAQTRGAGRSWRPRPRREARDHALWIQARAAREPRHARSGGRPCAWRSPPATPGRYSARALGAGRTLALERGRRRRRARVSSATWCGASPAAARRPRRSTPSGASSRRPAPTTKRSQPTTRSPSAIRRRASAERGALARRMGALPRGRPRRRPPTASRASPAGASATPAWPPSTGRRARSRTAGSRGRRSQAGPRRRGASRNVLRRCSPAARLGHRAPARPRRPIGCGAAGVPRCAHRRARRAGAALRRARPAPAGATRARCPRADGVDRHPAPGLRRGRGAGPGAPPRPRPRSRRGRRYLYPLGYWDVVRPMAEARGLDPLLVAALIRQESLFFPDAVSPADAHGLMQLLPGTARELAGDRGPAGARPRGAAPGGRPTSTSGPRCCAGCSTATAARA